MAGHKIPWAGVVTSAQPRIRLHRSFDELSHTYQGYVVTVSGDIGGEQREFRIGLGHGAQAKYAIKLGDTVSGAGILVADPRMETAELYRISKLRVTDRARVSPARPPPWQGVPPELSVYRGRGHRRLDAKTYKRKCTACIWGCRMAVEIIVDHWNPGPSRFRTETFCYGPLSCPFYKAGPARKVPGRKGMTWVEEDWIDEDATAHRGRDD